jgi:hypothetical protein
MLNKLCTTPKMMKLIFLGSYCNVILMVLLVVLDLACLLEFWFNFVLAG